MLALSALTFSSCATFKGNAHTGDYQATVVGTDAAEMAVTPDGMVIRGLNQSKAFMSTIRTVGTIASTWIVNDMMKYVRGQDAAEVVGGQKADVAKTALKESTEKVKIVEGAKVEALKIITP
jgi:hypothetical protein